MPDPLDLHSNLPGIPGQETNLATILLGSDTAANRNLIIEANRSLINDPDHLVAAQTYWIAAPTADAKPKGSREVSLFESDNECAPRPFFGRGLFARHHCESS